MIWKHIGYDLMLYNSGCALDAHSGKMFDIKQLCVPHLKKNHFQFTVSALCIYDSLNIPCFTEFKKYDFFLQ